MLRQYVGCWSVWRRNLGVLTKVVELFSLGYQSSKLVVGVSGEGSWVFLSLKRWSCLIWGVDAVRWLLECLEKKAGCSH